MNRILAMLILHIIVTANLAKFKLLRLTYAVWNLKDLATAKKIIYSLIEVKNEKENAIIDENQSLSSGPDQVRRLVNSCRNLLFGH